ncbi:hypothetical protein [Enterococcus cecorum]|uniref:hypothetical protein n=1 Tax=Enterococcus cecorum TaxID=44008 RepID=UPI002490A400|nr:hypothetical protein [Enterococcus cecorum]CAI3312771.1 type IV secretion system protein [Enterococcus cecorum]
MNPSNEIVKQLSQSLEKYSPLAYHVMDTITISFQVIGSFILFTMFLLQLAEVNKHFQREEGGMTVEVLINIAIKYLIAWCLMMSISYILDGILWVGGEANKWAANAFTYADVKKASDFSSLLSEKISFWMKPIVFFFILITNVMMALTTLIAYLLVYLRAIQLYIYKAIGPLLVVGYMHDETKSIAINFMKSIAACVLQGILIIITLGLVAVLGAADIQLMKNYSPLLFGANLGGGTLVISLALTKLILLIIKQGAIIFCLVGTQGLSKRLLGVN